MVVKISNTGCDGKNNTNTFLKLQQCQDARKHEIMGDPHSKQCKYFMAVNKDNREVYLCWKALLEEVK